jgi:arylsulfatase A-like enzyme
MSFENVVIISLDCLRREALGCYPQRFPWRSRILAGAGTPHIDRLCANGHRFEQAVSHAPFTPVAHASLFTGLIPPRHGLRRFLGTTLEGHVPTLAEALAAQGWQCGAVVGSHALSRHFGMDRGFAYYDDDIRTGIKRWHQGERRDAPEVTDRALDWLSGLAEESKFFLFVHYFDAHNITAQGTPNATRPLKPSSASTLRQTVRRRLPDWAHALVRPVDAAVRSIYYAVLRNLHGARETALAYFEAGGKYKREGRRFMLKQAAKIDVQIGRLIRHLGQENRLEKTLIIILADHGDDFMEHGEPTHRRYLYDTTLLVPLIISPSVGGRSVIGEQVRLVDVAPTVLSLLGVAADQDTDGRSLVDLMRAGTDQSQAGPPRDAYSETIFELMEPDREVEILSCYASLRAYPWKLIWDRLGNAYELYRVDRDPHERVDCARCNAQMLAKLQYELGELAEALPAGVVPEDLRVVERLEALGYLER